MKHIVRAAALTALLLLTLLFAVSCGDHPEGTTAATTTAATPTTTSATAVTTTTTAATTTAPPTPSEGLAFTPSPLRPNSCMVSGIGSCTDTDIVVPATHEGMAVIGIDDYAFYNNTDITSVYLPDGLLHIRSAIIHSR